MSRVAFVNLSSGKLAKSCTAQIRLRAACEGHARLVVIDSESELVTQVAALSRDSRLQLGILGGDGTLSRVMSCLARLRGREYLPVIVPIPFGTVCTTSTRWGAGNSPWKTLGAWLHEPAMILNRRETLLITVDGVENVGCTVGTGLVARFFEHYEAMGAHGLRTATRIAAESFFGSFLSGSMAHSVMQPVHGLLSVNGQPIDARAFTLIVSSVFKNVGLGIKVTYRAGDEPGRVALVTSSLPARRLGPQFWRVLSGRGLRDANGVDRLVDYWRFDFSTQGSVIIDGDKRSAQSIQVRPGPVWSVLTRAAP